MINTGAKVKVMPQGGHRLYKKKEKTNKNTGSTLGFIHCSKKLEYSGHLYRYGEDNVI